VVADLEHARDQTATASTSRTRRAADAVPRQLGAPTPWQRRDAAITALLALIGAGIVGICWNGASREAAFRDQVSWTVGAFLGCAIFALAGGYWVLVGFRRTRQALAQLRLDSEVVFELADPASSALPAELVATEGAFVIATGMHLAHRPDCLLARGKAVRAIPPTDQDAHQRCSMCNS
jgi:hypothetical protein